MAFIAEVTVVKKESSVDSVMWDKVPLFMAGNKEDEINLEKQLDIIDSDVNHYISRRGLTLQDVSVKVDLVA
jgi:hypothetical protein